MEEPITAAVRSSLEGLLRDVEQLDSDRINAITREFEDTPPEMKDRINVVAGPFMGVGAPGRMPHAFETMRAALLAAASNRIKQVYSLGVDVKHEAGAVKLALDRHATAIGLDELIDDNEAEMLSWYWEKSRNRSLGFSPAQMAQAARSTPID